jgi:16S rRNA (guanine966-N2)-methyltransferase
MRVIAGKYRSRTLDAPAGMDTRPTSDRLRETLFNVLAPRMEAARFLDLYAGSGAVGIEALSRGAAYVEFVERAQPALKALRANLARLGIGVGFDVRTSSVASYLKRAAHREFDLVFLDPPYAAAEEYEMVLGLAASVLGDGGLVIAEHRRKDKLEARYGSLLRARLLEQGDAALSFYAVEES